MNKQEGVYFIFAPQQKKIKIGRSNDISKRHKNLKTGFMDDGILLCGILTSQPVEVENVLHKQFEHLRVDGEWFLATKELVDFLLCLKGKFKDAIIYHDLRILQRSTVYGDVDVFLFTEAAKKIIRKIIVPLLFFLAGLSIAWDFIQYMEKVHNAAMFPHWSGIMLLVAVPMAMVILSRLILEYASFKAVLIYFGVVALNVIIGIINATTEVPEDSFVYLIHKASLLLYLLLAKQSMVFISLAKDAERIRHKANADYSTDTSGLMDRWQELINRIHRRRRVLKKIGYALVIGGIVALHVSLYLAAAPGFVKILLLTIMYGGGCIGLVLRLRHAAKRKVSLVLQGTLVLIILTSFIDTEAFIAVIFQTVLPALLPGMVFTLWYGIRDRQAEAEMGELYKKVNVRIDDLKVHIEKLNRELDEIETKKQVRDDDVVY